MASSLNKVLLVGSIDQDPDHSQTDSGTPKCTMTIVTQDAYTNCEGEHVEIAERHTVVAEGHLAETCLQHLSAGRQIYVEGSLQSRTWKEAGIRQSRAEVKAREVTFLGPPQDTVASEPAPSAVNPTSQRASEKRPTGAPGSYAKDGLNDIDSIDVDPRPPGSTCDWCGRPATYSDAAYQLCSNCRDQMFGY